VSHPVATPSTGPLSGAAGRYIGATVVIGVAVLAAAVWLGSSDLELLFQPEIALLALIGGASLVFPLRLYHDGSVSGFSLTAASMLTVAMRAPDPLAVVVTALMAAVGFAVATRSVVKTAFNTAQNVLSAALALVAARVVVGGDLGGDVLAGPNLVAVGTAAVVFATASMFLVVEVLHQQSGDRRTALAREIVAPTAWVALADFPIAVLLTILADRSAGAIVLALPMFAGLVLGYRGYAADREAGRQAQLLHGTSRQLLDGALDDAALEDAVGGLRELFGAERAVLAAGDSDGPEWLRPILAEVHRSGHAVMQAEEIAVLAAPVRVEGRVIGALAVSGRRGLSSWGPADLDLLSTVAGEIAATLRTRRLLGQIERERARLAAETSKLTDVLASASDGIVVLDAEGRVEACNPAMTELLGVRQVTPGVPWREVLRLEDEEGRSLAVVDDHPLVAALSGAARVERTTAALRRPDGELRWLRCSAAPVVSDGETDDEVEGEADGVVLVAVDLTREREVEQLRSDFIATVSHELRTPLTPLSGFLGVMREHGGALDDDRRAMMVEAMEKQVGRLSDLIGDLLQVAEMEHGLTNVHREVIDMPAAVEEIIELEAVAADDRGRIRLDLEGARAFADRTAVRRILRALVSNGFKHTAAMITVTTRHEDNRVVVRVADEGPGIPAGARDVIFQPFRRLGNHLHRTQGSGLGLSVARSLAEVLDGSLDIGEPPPSGGAVFVLRLPSAVGAGGPVAAPRVDNAV